MCNQQRTQPKSTVFLPKKGGGGMMVQPEIIYYARLTFCNGSKKTPKYVITAEAGYYPPMDALRGRDGRVSVYLMSKRETQTKSNIPAMALQAKNSLNLTGLKDYFVNGALSGFAYGYPYDKPTYSARARANPFFECREDGFLFVVHQNNEASTPEARQLPSEFEMIVLQGGKCLISAYCKALMNGGFDDRLAELRKQIK